MSRWQTTLLQLRQASPTVAMSLVGRNGLTRRTIMTGTSEAEGGGGVGVGVEVKVDVDVAEGVKVEAEEGGRMLTARKRRAVATRKGTWVDKNTGQWL